MVHHRSQFSINLRTAGGKVSSIHGPSADEPGMSPRASVAAAGGAPSGCRPPKE